jgi:sortase A
MSRLFQQYAGKVTSVIIVILLSLGLWQLAAAGWIQGKAIISQQLLNYSWQQTLNDSHKNNDQPGSTNKPWPWADTWPVAKLLVPEHNIEQIILAGDSGNSLAFGPGYSFASARPNTAGTTMISAHRDTHFNFLKKLKVNDTIFIETPGKTFAYQVYKLQIVDSKLVSLQPNLDNPTLVLVTCYPFDALTAGGTLRYLVYTAKVNAAKHGSKNSHSKAAI